MSAKGEISNRKCKDPCRQDCNTCHRPTNPCTQDCCKRVQQRIVSTKQDRANFYWMQQQLASGLREVVPKYARRTKPTAGKGQGCGSPPRTTLPPLWMYSLGTRKLPHPPVHREIRRRNTDYHGQRRGNQRQGLSHPDEIGTHRYYLHH